MEIFPHILVRIGGGAFDRLANLQFTQLAAASAQISALLAEKESRKAGLSEHLLAHIRGLPDPAAQNAVQNVRRDLFNDRNLKPAALAEARRHLTDGLCAELETYLALVGQLQQLIGQTRQVYDLEVRKARRQLQALAGDEMLRKGLVLSSQTLLDALAEYQLKDPGAFRKRENQTEYSLLRYLTRMYAKTSPFSTFNNLALAGLRAAAQPPLAFETSPAPGPVTGHIRLNNLLFKYLKDLFSASRALYRCLPLRPNPTLSGGASHFRYLTNHNNVESFQRVPANQVVALLLQVVGQSPAGMRMDALVQEVLAYIDAPEEDIEHYVKQLVEYGFFEYDLGVSGTDPDWDLKLVEMLQPLVAEPVPGVADLIACLRHIRRLAGQYASADVPRRKALLNEAFTDFRTVCMQLHEMAGLPEEERKTVAERMAEDRVRVQKPAGGERAAAAAEVALAEPAGDSAGAAENKEEAFRHQSSTYFSFKPEQMFYEDTTRQVAARFGAEPLYAWVEKLHALLSEMRLFRGNFDEKAQMAHFFRQQYGSEASVDLLTFYEEYYREVKRPEAERQARQRAEAGQKVQASPAQEAPAGEAHPEESPVPAIARRRRLLKQWHRQYEATLSALPAPNDREISLRLADIQAANRAVGFVHAGRVVNSHGAFVQFYQEPDAQGTLQLKGVLNISLSGYGKMISRFLHILPQQVTNATREWNGRLMDENSLFVEDCDASYFNANLHPPLMPFEIRVPGGHNTLPPGRQLPVTDFVVVADGADGELRLVHKPTGKQTYVFDLGFQGHNGRSQLFRLLEKFTKVEYLFAQPVINAVNNVTANAAPEAVPGAGITVRPRIVYEDQIILQRRSWHVPKGLVPARKPHENDAEYFLMLEDWRRKLAIPDEVFVCINPVDAKRDGADPRLFQKLGRDDHKPQYIRFGNPLLVGLFERLVAKAPGVLKIEEMLPHSGHLATIDGERFVTEYVVQWYNK